MYRRFLFLLPYWISMWSLLKGGILLYRRLYMATGNDKERKRGVLPVRRPLR